VTEALSLALAALAVPVLAAATYLAALAALARPAPAPGPAGARRRFALVVPAHDEEAGIASTVQNLLSLRYPRELFRVLVVADNCTDRTADRAREAGAEVLVRTEAARRGKGYALELAFDRVEREDLADAVVVVDADTLASENLLEAFSARLEVGADAVQAHYGVRNADAGWRTRLMALAFAIFHGVRSLARERLRLSCGLKGNGMCFTRRALRDVPPRAYSVVEDLEYGIRLGEAGIRVHYAPEARVLGEMPSTGAGSAVQRRRWEGGRSAIFRAHARRLLARAVAARDPVLFDLFLDLAVPPLTRLCAAAALGTAAAGLLSALSGAGLLPLGMFAAADLCLALYVVRGAILSGPGGLRDLALAPAYVFWKLGLLVDRSRKAQTAWVRTPREGKP